jgi:hypothetical protein
MYATVSLVDGGAAVASAAQSYLGLGTITDNVPNIDICIYTNLPTFWLVRK